MNRAIIAICLLFLNGPASALDVAAVPAGGRIAYQTQAYTGEWKPYGAVTVTEGDGKVFRMTMSNRGGDYNGMTYDYDQPIKKGDVFLINCRIRCVSTRNESQQGSFSFALRETNNPWRECAGIATTCTSEWGDIWARGVAGADMPPGTVKLQISLGRTEQVIEVSSIALVVYPAGTDVKKLPVTRLTYAGRSIDAAWRTAAKDRIARLRMAPLALSVIDRTARPVQDAVIEVHQIRNEFSVGMGAGANVFIDKDLRSLPDGLQKLGVVFDTVVFHNDLKWDAMSGDWDGIVDRHDINEKIRGAMSGLRRLGISIRGHTMIWPGYGADWGNLPRFVKAMKDSDPQLIAKLAMSRIDEISAFGHPWIEEWDVVNEARHNHALQDKCGKDFLADLFKRARARLPDTRLAINDFDIISARGMGGSHDEYERIIRDALERGAPIDIIGMQGHFGAAVPSPEQMLRVLDRFGAIGPDIRVTEATFAGDDMELKSDFLRDLLLVLYSHKDAVGILFWDGYKQFFDDKGQPTQLGSVLQKWHDETTTMIRGSTDAKGEFSARVHRGRYRIVISQDKHLKSIEVDIVNDMQPLVVTMP